MSNLNDQEIEQKYNTLLNKRKQIAKLEKEYKTLNTADKETQLIVTDY